MLIDLTCYHNLKIFKFKLKTFFFTEGVNNWLFLYIVSVSSLKLIERYLSSRKLNFVSICRLSKVHLFDAFTAKCKALKSFVNVLFKLLLLFISYNFKT